MDVLTTGQVAKVLRTSRDSVRRLIEAGDLEGERLNARAHYRVLVQNLIKYAKEHKISLDLPDQE